MRKFETLTEEQKAKALILAYAMAITAPREKMTEKDFYKFAADHGKLNQLRAEDFEKIKGMTFHDMAMLLT